MQQTLTEEFWEYLDRLVAENRPVIERRRGSVHPGWESMVYPLDYGYLEGTVASDGSQIDIFLGSTTPTMVDGVIVTVDLFKQDGEFTVLLGCNEAEQGMLLDFLNSGAMRATLIPRNPDRLALFEERKSVRRFRDEPIPGQILEKILAAATLAPSAHNRQPWRFAVLVARAAKERLAGAMGAELLRDSLADGIELQEAQQQVERSRERICAAPAAILLCLDRSVEDAYPDSRRQRASHMMMAQSVAIAGGYLLLAAHAVGLGGVWVCAPLFAQAAVRQALELPENWEAQGMILLGYPAEIPERRKRYPLHEVVRYIDE